MHDAARLPHGEGGVRVRAEVEVLDRERVRRVLVEQRGDALVDRGEPLAGVLPRGGLDHPAVERDQPCAVAGHDAVAGVGGARIDADDDHSDRDSAPRPGRLPVQPICGTPSWSSPRAFVLRSSGPIVR